MEPSSLPPGGENIYQLQFVVFVPSLWLTQNLPWLAVVALVTVLIISLVVGYLVKLRVRRSFGNYQQGRSYHHQSLQREEHQIQADNEKPGKGLMQYTAEIEDIKGRVQRDYAAVLITSLVKLLEAHDPYTRGHSERVRYYCFKIASRLGLSPEEKTALDQAAHLHDLGKISIPDNILHKAGALTPSEWAEVQLHPEKTVEFIRLLPFLQKSLLYIRSHHERWNGEGYPEGLSGENIPLGGRILAVADAYDAMTSQRPYRRAMNHQEAVDELRKGKGAQWDAKVVEVLIGVLVEGQPPGYR